MTCKELTRQELYRPANDFWNRGDNIHTKNEKNSDFRTLSDESMQTICGVKKLKIQGQTKIFRRTPLNLIYTQIIDVTDLPIGIGIAAKMQLRMRNSRNSNQSLPPSSPTVINTSKQT